MIWTYFCCCLQKYMYWRRLCQKSNFYTGCNFCLNEIISYFINVFMYDRDVKIVLTHLARTRKGARTLWWNKRQITKNAKFPCIQNNSVVTLCLFRCVCVIWIQIFTDSAWRKLVSVSGCSTDGKAFSIYFYDWGLLFTEIAKGNKLFWWKQKENILSPLQINVWTESVDLRHRATICSKATVCQLPNLP